ncbi:MAG TPA: tetratricopeptide repeat protein [Terracidiphilus sp.]|nr:tetratricopeptide repeat protein [Terracidiphilus sp.]
MQADASGSGSTLKEFYDAAMNFQREGQLDRAANEYRVFLGDALGQLATDRAQLGDYVKATSLYDEALAMAPDSAALQREYARAALLAGDYPRAETLARALIKEAAGNMQDIAEAHQILGRALHKMNQLQQARKELETAVALDASFVNAYDLAVVCLDLDDEKCAAQLFGEMQHSFGDSPELHMDFGRAYGNSDFAPRAVVEFRRAIAENARLPGAHYSLAATLLLTSQDDATVKEAVAELKKELEVSPHDFLAYAALGKIATSQHQYDEAERYLKRAAALNPANPDAFLYLGQMYYDNGHASDAETALREAIRLTTDPSRNRYQIQKAHYLLGRLLMQEHEEKQARAEMEIARSFANSGLSKDKNELAGLLQNNAEPVVPVSPSGNGSAAHTMQTKSDPVAAHEFDAFEKRIAPAIADSYNNLGAIAATSADYADALHDFERAGAWNPALDGLDLNLGRAAFMASKWADAITPLSRYINTHPQDAGIRGALAMSQFMTQNYSGCIETLKDVEPQIASIPQMQYIYAESLVKIGRLQQGEERLASLAAAHPEIPDVHRSYGEALALQGEQQKAIAELRVALKINNHDSEARYDLGKLEFETGDTAAAIPDLQAAAELGPTEPRYHRELAVAYEKALRNAEAAKERQLYERLEAAQTKSTPAEESHHP